MPAISKRRLARTIALWGAAGSSVMLALTSLGVLSPADAAGTSAGPATMVSGDTGVPLTSGKGDTSFTLKLPQDAACPGDSSGTANDGSTDWRWQTYMVSGNIDPGSLTFGSNGPTPASSGSTFRRPLFTTTGSSVKNQQTANASTPGGPGPILGVPNFDFQVFNPGDIPPGTYNLGIACSNATKNIPEDRYWNAVINVTNDPNGGKAQIAYTVQATSTSSSTTPSSVPSSSSSSSTSSSTTATSVAGATSTTSTTVAGVTSTTAHVTSTTQGSSGGLATTTTTASATGGSVTLDKSSGGPGTSVSVHASGYKPGTSAQVIFHSTPVVLATVTADNSGVVAASVTIPAGATPGSHSIEVLGTAANGASLSQSAPFTVTLARTGSDFAAIVKWAVLLAVLGAIAIRLGKQPEPLRHGISR